MDLAARPLAGVSVLYVEDDDDVREVMAMVLERFGAIVRPVATATEALALFLGDPPAVVLADIAMPGHDGFWLLREVRARRDAPAVPFIAFTALARERDRAQVLTAGFVEYLAKPAEPEVLVDAIVRVLATPRLPRSA
jgi:CheY-like chemotaxis protein